MLRSAMIETAVHENVGTKQSTKSYGVTVVLSNTPYGRFTEADHPLYRAFAEELGTLVAINPSNKAMGCAPNYPPVLNAASEHLPV
jgi:hypothetical protein